MDINWSPVNSKLGRKIRVAVIDSGVDLNHPDLQGLVLKNTKVLILSILLAVAVSFLTLVISPLSFETSEILARVSPNFLDLLICYLLL